MSVDLSVAIIFKNEIRCLERCLKSVQPLKERLSVEIVMADTGSTDGSRAVAERYADTVFDFLWVNDFSAARNAVLDRCAGNWALVMDCDEWLGGDLDALAAAVKQKPVKGSGGYVLPVRNYNGAELGDYAESLAYRLLYLPLKPRYEGAIHEQPVFGRSLAAATFEGPFLHHDGYVMLNDGSAEGEAKRQRNAALLRRELADRPEDLGLLMEYIDIAREEPDYHDAIRRAAALVMKNASPDARRYGAPILSRAAQAAYSDDLPELDEWLAFAESAFPDSYFTRIDTGYVRLFVSRDRNDLNALLRAGTDWLDAKAKFHGDFAGLKEMNVSPINRANPTDERNVRLVLADACRKTGDFSRAGEILSAFPWEGMGEEQVGPALKAVVELYLNSEWDVGPLLTRFWDGLRDDKAAGMFLVLGQGIFDASGVPGGRAPWEAFAALEGRCPLGNLAAERLRERKARAASPELLALAEKIKAVLSKYPPNDPAILSFKSSEQYKKVAYLLDD